MYMYPRRRSDGTTNYALLLVECFGARVNSAYQFVRRFERLVAVEVGTYSLLPKRTVGLYLHIGGHIGSRDNGSVRSICKSRHILDGGI